MRLAQAWTSATARWRRFVRHSVGIAPWCGMGPWVCLNTRPSLWVHGPWPICWPTSPTKAPSPWCVSFTLDLGFEKPPPRKPTEAAARLELGVAAGWVSPSFRGLRGGDDLMLSTCTETHNLAPLCSTRKLVSLENTTNARCITALHTSSPRSTGPQPAAAAAPCRFCFPSNYEAREGHQQDPARVC